MNLKKGVGFFALLAGAKAFSQEAQDATNEAREAFQQGVYQFKSVLLADQIREYLTVVYAIYRVIRSVVKKTAEKRLEAHTVTLLTKFISYVFYVAIGVYILSLFGINVSAIWGAAGVAGLAIGFAAQTSVSNVISGLFVLTEKTMKIGDFIEVDGVSGTVSEIGLLSVKINTLDNQLIRIPNSTIINSKLMNYASYDLRRFCFPLEVSYDTDPQAALDAALAVPARCPSAILNDADHAPAAVFTGFADSGITLSLNVWFKRQDLVKIKNEVFAGFLNVCKERNIEIPYNKLDVTILNQKA